MLLFFYKIIVQLYGYLIRLAAPFSTKAKEWTKGRKLIEETLTNIPPNDKPIWLHSASLGEFEQARPIVDRLKKEYPHKKVLLTFFSASGYLPRKNYQNADFVTYLPLDSPQNASEFVEKVNPSLVIWIKYDLWYFHLTEIKKRNVPLILVAAQFRPSQIYFRSYAPFYKKALASFSHFFVQNAASAKILKESGFENSTIAPDTRFDRVFTVVQNAQEISEIAEFKNGEPMIVAGSTWPKDEKVLFDFLANLENPPKLLIAPHEITEAHLQQIMQLFGAEAKRFTQCKKEELAQTQILILDTMGMLSAAYRYGEFALIGGGFGKGIHNILEATVYGIPVFIGPKYQKFQEAKDLVEAKTVFPINDAAELLSVYNAINSEQNLETISERQKEYINKNLGGTEAVFQYLKESDFI